MQGEHAGELRVHGRGENHLLLRAHASEAAGDGGVEVFEQALQGVVFRAGVCEVAIGEGGAVKNGVLVGFELPIDLRAHEESPRLRSGEFVGEGADLGGGEGHGEWHGEVLTGLTGFEEIGAGANAWTFTFFQVGGRFSQDRCPLGVIGREN